MTAVFQKRILSGIELDGAVGESCEARNVHQITIKQLLYYKLQQFLDMDSLIQEVLLTAIAFGLYYAYRYAKFVYVNNQAESYKKQYQNKGYTVKVLPHTFRLFGHNGPNIPPPEDPLYLDWDIVIQPSLGRNMIVVMNQGLIKEYFTTKAEDWEKINPLNNTTRTVDHGIAFGQPKYWRKRRQQISKAFQFSLFENMAKITVEIANRKIVNVGKLRDYSPMLNEITTQAIVRDFFGFSLEEYENYKIEDLPIVEYEKQISNLIGYQTQDWGFIYFGKWFVELGLRALDREVNRRFKVYQDVLGNLIKEKQAALRKLSNEQIQKKTKSILEELILAGVLDKLTLREVIHEFNSMVSNFQDTITIMTSNAIIEIEGKKNTAVREKLIAEIKEYIKTDADINPDTLNKMKYLNGMLTQTLRKYPIANNLAPRLPLRSISIGGVSISKDTAFLINVFGLGYNPKYFNDPEKIDPDRHVLETSTERKNYMIPFSSGDRNCIGQHYSNLEGKILLIKLMNDKFKIY